MTLMGANKQLAGRILLVGKKLMSGINLEAFSGIYNSKRSMVRPIWLLYHSDKIL